LDGVADAKNLADVNVRALRINLRVVEREQRAVDGVRGCDVFAGVIRTDDIRCLAILAGGAKAEGVSRDEVAAGRVDGRVDRCKLICGDVICGRDTVADVTLHDGVRARAVCCCHGGGEDREHDSNYGESSSEHCLNKECKVNERLCIDKPSGMKAVMF